MFVLPDCRGAQFCTVICMICEQTRAGSSISKSGLFQIYLQVQPTSNFISLISKKAGMSFSSILPAFANVILFRINFIIGAFLTHSCSCSHVRGRNGQLIWVMPNGRHCCYVLVYSMIIFPCVPFGRKISISRANSCSS